jgi:hypothetical protein
VSELIDDDVRRKSPDRLLDAVALLPSLSSIKIPRKEAEW